MGQFAAHSGVNGVLQFTTFRVGMQRHLGLAFAEACHTMGFARWLDKRHLKTNGEKNA